MSSNLDQSVLPSSIPKTPELIPVFFMNIKTSQDPELIFTNTKASKALTLASIIDGEFKTVDNKLGIELDVSQIKGFDDLTTDLTVGVNRLDCKLYGKSPNGSGVYISYGGVVQLLDPTIKVITNQAKTSTFEEGYVTCNPTFQFDETIEEKYKWALKENFIGKGRFVRGSNGVLYVQYYVYVLR